MSAIESVDTSALAARVEAWQGRRALVVGDLMLDEYREGEVERMSPEAPVPIVRVSSLRTAPGGAGNVARNVASLGARCVLVGVVGRDGEGERLLADLDGVGIDASGVVALGSRPTTHKLRISAGDRQLVRVDREEVGPFAESETLLLRSACAEAMDGADVVVLQDYGKGLLAGGLAEWIVALARERGLPVVADPKRDLARFRGADLVKPNASEAEALGVALGAGSEIGRALLEKLREAISGGEIVVTRGAAGMTALDGAGRLIDVPTEAREVFDVQGAGDTTLAVLALAKVARASLAEACIVANAAASVAVAKVGTAVVSVEELNARLPRVLEAFRTRRQDAEGAEARSHRATEHEEDERRS